MMKSRRLLLFCVNRATTNTIPSKALRPCAPIRLLSSSSDSSEKQHEDYLKQLQELNDEREQLFGFTPEEHEAWKSPQIHSSKLLDAVEQARRELHSSTIRKEEADDSDYRQEQAIEHESFPPQSTLLSTQKQHKFTHLDKRNKGIHMVNVGDKIVTQRRAKASSRVVFPPQVMAAFSHENGDFVGPKGPIFETAKLAGIMAAKRTSDLIPLCHPLPLEQVELDIVLEENTAVITCECHVTSKTGVEMEALTGASVAALTLYDMCKAISHRITIQETRLVSKSGGKRNVREQHEE